MASAHFKCMDGRGIKVKGMPIFTSEAWDIPSEDARKLLGGEIYFHETKGKPSYFGGIVKAFRIISTEKAHSKRVVFEIEATSQAKNRPWVGISHINAHYSGVIE